MKIARTIIRWGLISGLALGGITLLVGPQRMAMGIAQIRAKTQETLGGMFDDPVALRMQLQGLADQYPDRIAEVRGEIAEVEHQLGQFHRDVDVASRVVALTTDDLGKIKTLVARAETQVQSSARPVAIRYEGVRYDIDEAYTEARRINHVRLTYNDRLAHDKQQSTFLTEQKTRLVEILNKLEDEFNTYQAQLWQLDREIDTIERNDRLIELTKEQQATLDSYDKMGRVGSLKQVQAKLAQLRAEQEAKLATLAKHNFRNDYESKAEMDLNMENGDLLDDPFTELESDTATENEAEGTEVSDSKSLVWSGILVIE